MNFLEEIRKNAGEFQKETNEKISTKPNSLKRKIVENTGIYENDKSSSVWYAQHHVTNDILDLILQGKYSEAADQYIRDQVNSGYRIPPKADATINKIMAGAFAKGFKADREKAKQISKEAWGEFKREYENIVKTETKPRERQRTKGAVDASGQVRTSVSPTMTGKKLRDKVMKLRDEVLSELKLTSDPVKKEDLESHVDGLNTLLSALEYTIAGRAVLPPKTPEQLEQLKQRYIKIGKEFQGIKGASASPEEDDDYDPPSSIRPEIRDQAIRNLERAKAQGWNTLESLNLKGKILAESLEYKGQNFWSNYTMSMITKAFAKDLKLFKEETKYIYAKVFGASSIPIFEYMEENSQALNEVVQSKSNFLFETYSFDVLSEVTPTASVDRFKGGAGRVGPAAAAIAAQRARQIERDADSLRNTASSAERARQIGDAQRARQMGVDSEALRRGASSMDRATEIGAAQRAADFKAGMGDQYTGWLDSEEKLGPYTGSLSRNARIRRGARRELEGDVAGRTVAAERGEGMIAQRDAAEARMRSNEIRDSITKGDSPSALAAAEAQRDAHRIAGVRTPYADSEAMAGAAASAGDVAASAGEEVAKTGFLAGLWDKIKQFGGVIVGRLAGLISSGVAWAKNIAEQGMGWIAANPVAQVAVPAIVLAGSAVGAVKLINRMRRKSGEKKLSREERRQIKRISTQKSREIERQTEKIKGRTVRKSDARDQVSDEEDLVSNRER